MLIVTEDNRRRFNRLVIIRFMKQWPPFDDNGGLPLGIHQASISDVLQYFGTSNLQRQIVARRLERIHNLAQGTRQLARFVVFGSFVTAKPEPNDVDVFMLQRFALERVDCIVFK